MSCSDLLLQCMWKSVTLGDEEASRRGVQKTVLERKGPSTFTCAAEIISKTELRVHHNLESTVDAFLAGRFPNFEVRRMHLKGSAHEMHSIQEVHRMNPKGSTHEMVPIQREFFKEDEIVVEDHSDDEKMGRNIFNLDVAGKWDEISHEVGKGFHLFVYGITENCVLQAIKELQMDGMIGLTNNISEADAFLALHSKLKKNSQIQAVAKSRDIPVFVTKTSSLMQITKAIRALVKEHAIGFEDDKAEGKMSSSEKSDALEEARLAIEQVVIPRGECVRLLPRPSHIITAQIDLVESYKLKWEMVGLDSDVSLQILPQVVIEEKNVHGPAADQRSESEDLEDYDDIMSLQNGVARLPLLPE